MLISGDEVISCILKKLTPCLPQDGKAFICYKYLNIAIKCHAELVSASHETLKRVRVTIKLALYLPLAQLSLD